jgi:para-nitrobenzyl esterase
MSILFILALAGCGGSGQQACGGNCGCGAACLPPDPTIVKTQSGTVQGVIAGDLIAFRGIPYAAPPVGDLRWKPPAPPASWQGIRDASSFGNICAQIDPNTHQFLGDEDCLTLSVFTSNPPPRVKQPVMFYIHGGGNTAGSAHGAADIPPLATHGVIVVTVQYRLGLLGFLAHPLLAAEGGGSSGNYGLMDQIAALTWVQKNIAAFGGDPSRVMAFGESAGAIDMEALIVSPMAKGLFSRAGRESVGLLTGDVYSLDASAAFYEKSIQPLGCDTAADVLACLRAVPADTLTSALTFPPIVDTTPGPISPVLTIEPKVIPVDPFQALQQNGSPVPLLMGSNRDELTIFFFELSNPLDESGYEAALHAEFDPVGPNVANQVLSLYPASSYASPGWALASVHSDYYVTCKERRIALAASGAQRPVVWRYLFTHVLENPTSFLGVLGAFHSEELNFVFGNLQSIFDVPYTPSSAELQLSDDIMGYWTRFAATGDPNGAGAVQWLPYDSTTEHIQQLDDTTITINGYHNDQCDYFATLPPPPA